MVLQELIRGSEEGEVEELTEFDKFQYLSEIIEGFLRAPPYNDWNPIEAIQGTTEKTEAVF
jgi:hypothetical protein